MATIPRDPPRRMRDVLVLETTYVVARGEEPFYELILGSLAGDAWRVPVITRDEQLWRRALTWEATRTPLTVELALVHPLRPGQPVRFYVDRITDGAP